MLIARRNYSVMHPLFTACGDHAGATSMQDDGIFLVGWFSVLPPKHTQIVVAHQTE
jgi:hypothetical protein